jgi:hypothetical protein
MRPAPGRSWRPGQPRIAALLDRRLGHLVARAQPRVALLEGRHRARAPIADLTDGEQREAADARVLGHVGAAAAALRQLAVERHELCAAEDVVVVDLAEIEQHLGRRAALLEPGLERAAQLRAEALIDLAAHHDRESTAGAREVDFTHAGQASDERRGRVATAPRRG